MILIIACLPKQYFDAVFFLHSVFYLLLLLLSFYENRHGTRPLLLINKRISRKVCTAVHNSRASCLSHFSCSPLFFFLFICFIYFAEAFCSRVPVDKFISSRLGCYTNITPEYYLVQQQQLSRRRCSCFRAIGHRFLLVV